ncbi:MAG: hypothetical protein LBM69_01190 [Lachnospiraceae bacterium]|jgi:hypothetical protein|nr:hypothetical protein [Lachnospiraceae bacterium]
MDNIIYLIAHRDSSYATKPIITAIQKSSTVRILRTQIGLIHAQAGNQLTQVSLTTEKSDLRIHPLFFWKRSKEAKKKQQSELQQEEWLTEQINEILTQLSYHITEHDYATTIYHDNAGMTVWFQDKSRRQVWRSLWPYPTFYSYRDPAYASALLKETHCFHYLVLGYDRDVLELLHPTFRRMKSLHFILDYLPGGFEEAMEALYDEYGLTASYSWVSDTITEHPFRHTPIACSIPSVILDYTAEPRVPLLEIAKGSIWLDMDSIEEKQRYMEDKGNSMIYLSLKKLWLG